MLNLLLAIHCHQPVGNFDKVIEEAYQKAYLPFIEVLERHPKIRLSMHYSGSLLDWLLVNHPEFIEKIKKLVKEKRIEILAGGYYEPILALIPEQDALGQIKLLKDSIEKIFSYKARGAWVAERVWEPSLPKILAKAGIEYSIIDDSHFKLVGFDAEDLSGYYVTEEHGSKFNIFPSSEKLRYFLPFKLPEVSLDYFKKRLEKEEELALSFGDDGEKFGFWPHTYKWVYEEKWLDNFFTALDVNDAWIKTLTFSDYLSTRNPTGRIYLSCASYREMQEWSLGYYRNFLIKYPEANNMHKKMLYVSKQLEQSKINNQTKKSKAFKASLELAKRHLYMSQANDAYWHGVFGGLYLYHLRASIYHHLIESQKLIDHISAKWFDIAHHPSGSMNSPSLEPSRAPSRESHPEQSRRTDLDLVKVIDFDCDGHDELIVNTKYFNLSFRPYEGATLSDWDYKPKSFNLVNTLSRKHEFYHEKLKQSSQQKINISEASISNEPSSIHDVMPIKQEGLENLLFYDSYPRYCLRDYFLDKDTRLENFITNRFSALGDFNTGSYDYKFKTNRASFEIILSRRGLVDNKPITVSKTIRNKEDHLNVDYSLELLEPKTQMDIIFGIEFNLSIFDSLLNKSGQEKNIDSFSINDSWNKAKINFAFTKGNIWYYPVETVSDSESGIDKTYQEICLLFWWPLNIVPKKIFKQSFSIGIQ